MKERIIYVAYDDTEFDTEEECVQYEEEVQEIMDFLRENVFCYAIGGALLNFDGRDLKEQLVRFDNAFTLAHTVEIKEEVPWEVNNFLKRYFGFADFEEELRAPGKYAYGFEEYKWLPQ